MGPTSASTQPAPTPMPHIVAGHLKLEWVGGHQGGRSGGAPTAGGSGAEEVVAEHPEPEGAGEVVAGHLELEGVGRHQPELEGVGWVSSPLGYTFTHSGRWGRYTFSCWGVYSQFEIKVLNNNITIGVSIYLLYYLLYCPGSSAWMLHANNINSIRSYL